MKSLAFTTLTSDQYIPLTSVLIKSLVNTGGQADIVVMSLPDVSEAQKTRLKCLSDRVVIKDITPFPLPDQCQIYYGNYRTAMQKINAWTYEEYKKIIFLDSDMLVLKNIDELFDCEELSAVPTLPCEHHTPPVEMPNSGLLIIEPSRKTFDSLYKALNYPSLINWPQRGYKWFLTDQELVTAFYSSQEIAVRWRANAPFPVSIQKTWLKLPYYYNAVIGDKNRLKSVWKDEEIRIAHFTDCVRPWEGGKTELDFKWMALFKELIKGGIIQA